MGLSDPSLHRGHQRDQPRPTASHTRDRPGAWQVRSSSFVESPHHRRSIRRCGNSTALSTRASESAASARQSGNGDAAARRAGGAPGRRPLHALGAPIGVRQAQALLLHLRAAVHALALAEVLHYNLVVRHLLRPSVRTPRKALPERAAQWQLLQHDSTQLLSTIHLKPGSTLRL